MHNYPNSSIPRRHLLYQISRNNKKKNLSACCKTPGEIQHSISQTSWKKKNQKKPKNQNQPTNEKPKSEFINSFASSIGAF